MGRISKDIQNLVGGIALGTAFLTAIIFIAMPVEPTEAAAPKRMVLVDRTPEGCSIYEVTKLHRTYAIVCPTSSRGVTGSITTH